jgi:hypothetical protein
MLPRTAIRALAKTGFVALARRRPLRLALGRLALG